MIQTGDVHKCCGCSACEAVCNHNAIVMQEDYMGFKYPQVLVEKCVGCRLCEKVCPFQGEPLVVDPQMNMAYAVRHKDIKEIETSRSGAVFIALSDWILERGGTIYGAGYGKHFRVKHKRAENKSERNEFKGSKYSQSDISSIFQDVKCDLRNGLYVLFSGTPCQVAAIKAYVPTYLRDKLFLIDIICHGVASPAVWESYLSYLEKKVGQSIKEVNFRDKSIFGWSGLHKESFVFEDNKKRTFQYTYYSDLIIRQSCNVCPFTNTNRLSDITIGDFWGWEKVCPTFNVDDKGCSFVLINSPQGKEWFENVTGELKYIPVPLANCMQPNLMRPTPENILRVQFETDYKVQGFVYVMNKYSDVGYKYYYRRLKNIIGKFIAYLRK